MNAPIVKIRNLGHVYMARTPFAQKSLDDISVTVTEGEFIALIGPTGSGKSTILQHINGIYTPQTGSVRVLGRDLGKPETDLTLLRREVGLVLQNPEQQVFERYVGDDVSFGPRMSGMSGKELTRRVRWAMDQVGLDFNRYRDRPTFALSGGERRKVGIAGVVALKPRILLLDEPTAGLDPAAHEELLECLARLQRQGTTLIIATHSMDDVAALAERVVALDKGRVVLDGPVRDIFSRAGELRLLGLELPVASAVVHELLGRGIDVRQDVLTLTEAEDAILVALGMGR